ncbi:MFS transporter [Nocardia abscessus]|uniref:MFS transporter n=1 Tax=Nocardia abscessus TaxID=120957 RepID=A0ABS0C1H6_9NOCA|nr:MFS transporter [Nocardia abscessus]MBF6224230.1 MFS transporter [Nocardia abscessus]
MPEHAAVELAKSDPAPADSSRSLGGSRWWLLIVIALAQLMVVLDATIVNIALPSAQHDLGFSDNERQWVVTAYALAFGSLLLLGGRIADLFGRKATFLVGLVGFAVASAVGGAAPSFEILVAARAGQGIFAALLAPAALSLLTITFTEGKERATAFSVYGAVSGAGSAIGLLLGGVLTETLSWRWTLYVNLAFALVAVIGGALLLPRVRRDRTARLDVPGITLVSAGLFSLVYGCTNAETNGWADISAWGLLVASAVLLAAFVWWQTRTNHPVLPLRILTDRTRAASMTAIFISGAGMFGIFLYFTYYLQINLGYTPIRTGLAFMPMVLGLMIAAITANNVLIPRITPKLVVPPGMAITAIALVWMTTFDASSAFLTHVLPALFVAGFGMGLIVAPAMSAATLGVAAADSGAASATVNAAQQVGGSIGTAFLATMSTSAADDYLASHGPVNPDVFANAQLTSYATAYWWSAAILVTGMVVTAALYRRGVLEQSDSQTPTVHM